MAALRQTGIPIPTVTSFDMTKEYASIWAEINENNGRYDCDYETW
jgi:hypothetical protein